MVGPAGRHGCSPAMGEWEDLLLPGRQLLEVQRPVSPPRPLLFHISRRFMVDSGSPPFPRDAQDWLFGCYDSNQVQVGESSKETDSDIIGHKSFSNCLQGKCIQKRVIASNKTGVQVGEFEEQLVSERTISSNPFLVITLRHLGFS